MQLCVLNSFAIFCSSLLLIALNIKVGFVFCRLIIVYKEKIPLSVIMLCVAYLKVQIVKSLTWIFRAVFVFTKSPITTLNFIIAIFIIIRITSAIRVTIPSCAPFNTACEIMKKVRISKKFRECVLNGV